MIDVDVLKFGFSFDLAGIMCYVVVQIARH